ncbi:hypothetical protein BJ742DRAFT_833294 [Cladochytrium replicatum]|nr:hypothetical protein BJ742DRAFT_833294 [Cladochytrium replicatum]
MSLKSSLGSDVVLVLAIPQSICTLGNKSDETGEYVNRVEITLPLKPEGSFETMGERLVFSATFESFTDLFLADAVKYAMDHLLEDPSLEITSFKVVGEGEEAPLRVIVDEVQSIVLDKAANIQALQIKLPSPYPDAQLIETFQQLVNQLPEDMITAEFIRENVSQFPVGLEQLPRCLGIAKRKKHLQNIEDAVFKRMIAPHLFPGEAIWEDHPIILMTRTELTDEENKQIKEAAKARVEEAIKNTENLNGQEILREALAEFKEGIKDMTMLESMEKRMMMLGVWIEEYGLIPPDWFTKAVMDL